MNPKETEEPAWVKKKQQKGGFDHKKTVYDGQKYGSYYRGLSFEAEGTVGQNLNLLCHWAVWVSRDQSDWIILFRMNLLDFCSSKDLTNRDKEKFTGKSFVLKL